jgi:hypothetical protein
MRGTVIANNAAISMSTNDTLEGRALSTAGSVTVDGVLGYTPTGCGSAILNGPSAPNLASTADYVLFSANGAVTNSGITYATGDIGTNVGLTTGFDDLTVNGMVHPIPDVSTAACAADLGNVYTYLNTLNYDIELLYPAQFGRNLVLTPHTYLLNAATVFTDTLYLDARNNANAVFVIQINGALSTSTYAKVLLINGTQAKNVFWKVDGATEINDYSQFKGTLISNNGAVSLNTGVDLKGRAFTTTGELNTFAITATKPSGLSTGIATFDKENVISIYPNPFIHSATITVSEASAANSYELKMFNILGDEVMNTTILKKTTSLDISNLSKGIYFYKVMNNNKVVQTGKVVSQQ